MLGNSEKIFPSVIMAMARKRSPFSSMIFPSPFSTLHLFELSHCCVWLPEVSRNNTGNKMVIWGCHRTWPYKYGEGYCCNSRTNASQRLGLDTNHLALEFQSLFTTVSLLTHRSMIQTSCLGHCRKLYTLATTMAVCHIQTYQRDLPVQFLFQQ